MLTVLPSKWMAEDSSESQKQKKKKKSKHGKLLFIAYSTHDNG